jgi:hypothetical protein
MSRVELFLFVFVIYHYWRNKVVYYGYVLWNSPEIQHICSAWHAAIKRVWAFPSNCHRYIASAFSASLLLHDELYRRALKFHFA